MKIKKTLITLSIAAMTMPAFAADNLPKGCPDFSKIKETDYLKKIMPGTWKRCSVACQIMHRLIQMRSVLCYAFITI